MIRILFNALKRSLENSKQNDHFKEEEENENKIEIRADKKDKFSILKQNELVTAVSVNAYENTNSSHQPAEKMNEFYANIKTAEAMTTEKNDVFTLDANDREYFAAVTDLKYQFISGDVVKVKGEKSDDGEFVIANIEPKFRKKFEYGRVTGLYIEKGYAVFEESTLILFNTLNELKYTLKIHEEYKYEATESVQKYDGRTFEYRVLSIVEKFNSKISGRGIIIRSNPFKIFINPDKCERIVSRTINIYNISQKAVDLMSVQAIPLNNEGKGIVSLDMADRKINYNISAKNGNFKVYFRINTSKIGTFRFELIADFNNFQESHIFTVEISKSCIVPGPRLGHSPRFVDIRLAEYSIPAELREIDYSKAISAIEILSEKFAFLQSDLDSENYLEKMRYGIYLEEIALERAFANYRLQNVVFETSGDFLKLYVKDLAEKRPSIVIGDKIIATDPQRTDEERPMYEGFIHKIENESIKCKFHEEFHTSHNEKTFNVEFNFSRTIYKRQQHALDVTTSKDSLGYDFLFPKKVDHKDPQVDAKVNEEGILTVNGGLRPWYNNFLNKYQKNAVVNVLRGECRPLPYIFFGCPGSGKTQTVIEAILQIYSHLKTSRILVATPSNSAANLITEMLLNSNGVSDKNFIRLVSNNQVEKDLIPDHISKYCATVSISSNDIVKNSVGDVLYEYERTKSKGIRSSMTKHMLLDYRIIIATLNCYGAFLQMKFGNVFTHLFIDEAGQSIEPENLIPLTVLNKKNCQCVLAGDPNQLGPILTSRFGKHFNFHLSMLERLLLNHPYYQQIYGDNCNEFDPKFVTKLKINYRALPSLLKVYNDLFYKGELESAVDEIYSEEALLMSNAESFLWPYSNKKCSVFFVNVDNGRNRKIQESCSWYNEEEIRAIMSFLHKLNSNHVPFKEIGIVTPYSLQVKKIKHQISVGTSDTDLKVGTVEEFQGQERLIIIVSTVRTEEKFVGLDSRFGLGFLQCPKRMNVAISRPKALLVVFGKESLLKKDENWNHLINYAKENRTYVTDKF